TSVSPFEATAALPSFEHSTNLIHSVLVSTSSFIPVSVVIVAITLIQSIVLNRTRYISEGSEPHLFVIALMVAHKLHDDHSVVNVAWSKVTGLPKQTVALMEREFCLALDYRLFVHQHTYDQWVDYFVLHEKL
ncbi:uncharacterized protein BJ171DRAFT_402419, partial [Polychytrium aggregatum]|uniref:uncharacterized protein n=1 Tax=Polychytrium aggregatum TaxID=110093 RepID=UPI0022FDCE2E